MFAALKKLAIAAFATALLAVPANAADWAPDEPITVKVGFGHGGAADALARAVGEAMEKNTGWKVVVENVEGGGGLTMLTGLQAAAPDGKTVGFGVTVPVWINLQKRGDQLPFKLDSFDWLGTVGLRFPWSSRAISKPRTLPGLWKCRRRTESWSRPTVRHRR